MIRLSSCLALTVAAGATASLGAVLGYASNVVYVIGLGPIAMGLTASAAISVVSLMMTGGVGRAAWAQAALAILLGWSVGQWAEDRAFRASWSADFASAQQAAAGAEYAAAVAADDLAFYAAGAEAALAAEIHRAVGFDGPAGRWLFRADAGVRLIGPASGGRGLPVGRTGAIVWALLEILLAILVARTVLRQVSHAVAAGRGAPQDS